MAKCLFRNNVSTLLAQDADTGDTTLLLMPGTGSRFPAIGAGNWFYVTVVDVNTGDLEVMRVTNRLTDALTVERGMDASVPRFFAADSLVEMRLVTSALNDIYFANYGDAAFGVPILDAAGKIKHEQLPDDLLTEDGATDLYLLKTARSSIDGVAALNSSGFVPDNQIPDFIQRVGDANVKFMTKVEPVSSGDAIHTGDSTISGTLDVVGATSTGALTSASVTTPGAVNAASVAATGNASVGGTLSVTGAATIRGGAARGRLTVSTSPPSGSGAEGDEWYQLEA